MAYSECFYIIGIAMAAALLAVCFLKKPSGHKAAA
jgi:hypothetical protein